MEKLKSCPFCGYDMIWQSSEHNNYYCVRCECEGPTGSSYEEAEKLWNTRTEQEGGDRG